MRKSFWALGVCIIALWNSFGQTPNDSIDINSNLGTIVVTSPSQNIRQLSSTQSLQWLDSRFLWQNRGATLMHSLQKIPGVQAMNIGAGTSKPIIRGLGFSRIAFVENGIKQESQQWGADHGLEIDPFKAEQVAIIKGASSLLFGSDALGGVIEVQPPIIPVDNGWWLRADCMGQSYNLGTNASIYAALKRNNHFVSFRISQGLSGDMALPTREIYYLSRHIPINNGSLKNTATRYWASDAIWCYGNGGYQLCATAGIINRKEGFFPGAHGLPDLNRLTPDNNKFNIDLPHNRTHHTQASLTQTYYNDNWIWSLKGGYQWNHREEWSSFHTHYPTQQVPPSNPNQELKFDLHTYDLLFKTVWSPIEDATINGIIQGRHQTNHIGGYSFLMPKYNKQEYATALVALVKPSKKIRLEGGIRFDFASISIAENYDEHLFRYLLSAGNTPQTARAYSYRSSAIQRQFSDLSGSLGVVYEGGLGNIFKLNIGHSFRTPTAVELSANGVHHGAFRHEQGSSLLQSEKGWQLGAEYSYNNSIFSVQISPFCSYFSNYIYLEPTGEWSLLPHSGQIYRYTQNKAVIGGAEVSFSWQLNQEWKYAAMADAVYTYNVDQALPLPFSPPIRFNQNISWKNKIFTATITHRYLSCQKRISRNEEPTNGAQLFDLQIIKEFSLRNKAPLTVALEIENLLNTRYYNHLSFYRKIGLPEPGINIQLKLSFTLNHLEQ